MRVPPGKLRPSDRFDIELAPVKGRKFDDNTIEVHWAAQRRLKQLGVDADITAIQTLRDYVAFFCNFSHWKPRTGDPVWSCTYDAYDKS